MLHPGKFSGFIPWPIARAPALGFSRELLPQIFEDGLEARLELYALEAHRLRLTTYVQPPVRRPQSPKNFAAPFVRIDQHIFLQHRQLLKLNPLAPRSLFFDPT